jgi:hypothetical protein
MLYRYKTLFLLTRLFLAHQQSIRLLVQFLACRRVRYQNQLQASKVYML